jgi:TetR/AcrR family tetracycline transcriptional repressor
VATKKAVREPVDRDRIAATAMDIINEVGVDKLTMRAVAGRLDVSAMALYHHVEDKDELLRLIGDQVLGQFELPDPDSDEWRTILMSVCIAAVDTLLEVPGLSSVLLTSKILPNARRMVQFCIHQLERAGLDHATAQEVYAGIQTLALGRLLIEENASYRLSAAPHPDDEIRDYTMTLRSRESFRRALSALIDGATSA